MEYQLFKGGWNKDIDDRLVINQRPADGHQKAGVLEDHRKLTNRNFEMCNKCSAKNILEVGDIISLHTTLTFSNITGFGIAVNVPEEGLKFKVVTRDKTLDLSKILVDVFKYDETQEQYVKVQDKVPLDKIEDIGNEQLYYAGFTEKNNDIIANVTDLIGFEVVSVPDGGVAGDFEIETRLHNSQPVRPPAYLGCC